MPETLITSACRAAQVQGSVLVKPAQVAGIKPTVGQQRRIDLFVDQIAGHHRRRTDMNQSQAVLEVRLALGLADFDRYVLEWAADATSRGGRIILSGHGNRPGFRRTVEWTLLAHPTASESFSRSDPKPALCR